MCGEKAGAPLGLAGHSRTRPRRAPSKVPRRMRRSFECHSCALFNVNDLDCIIAYKLNRGACGSWGFTYLNQKSKWHLYNHAVGAIADLFKDIPHALDILGCSFHLKLMKARVMHHPRGVMLRRVKSCLSWNPDRFPRSEGRATVGLLVKKVLTNRGHFEAKLQV